MQLIAIFLVITFNCENPDICYLIKMAFNSKELHIEEFTDTWRFRQVSRYIAVADIVFSCGAFVEFMEFYLKHKNCSDTFHKPVCFLAFSIVFVLSLLTLLCMVSSIRLFCSTRLVSFVTLLNFISY